MKTYLILKLTLFIIALGAWLYKRNQAKKEIRPDDYELDNLDTPKTFYSINDGNQKELIYAPEYKKEWFDELDQKYSWDDFNEYDNRFWEYMYQLFDTLPKIAGKTQNDPEFFNNLNREQKLFYSLLVFNGDTDNGGVYQFFFNRPEFAFAVLETFEELKLTKLKNDYEKCLDEFIGTTDSYLKRKEVFNDSTIDWEKRWEAFTNGYDDIKSAEVLEDYFYNPDFKKELYKTFTDYADRNINQFARK